MGAAPAQAQIVNALLCAIFFLSGAAALAFETLWFRLAALMLGNTVWAAALVLAGFMGGLALGSLLAVRRFALPEKPVLLYAALEAMVALSGMALVLLLPLLPHWTAPVFGALSELPLVSQALRLLLAFLLFVVPATAMGLSLPLLTQALSTSEGFGIALGRLYGWNTVGAMLGAVLTEWVLIRWFGLRGAGVAAGALAVVAALGAVAWHFVRRPAAPMAPRPGRIEMRLLLAAGVAGMLMLALEVTWFRFALLYVRGTGLVFAMMLALVLGGLGAGALIAAHWLREDPEASRALPLLALATGFATALSYLLVSPVWLLPTQTEWLRLLSLGAALMLPGATLSGILFSFIGAELGLRSGASAATAGWLTLANTAGAMLGALLGGLVLLPLLGIELALCGLAAGYVLVALLCGRWYLWLLPHAACLLMALLLPFAGLMQRHLDAATQPYRALDRSGTAVVREGLGETVQLLRRDQWGQPAAWRLVTNNYSMSNTERDSQRYMKLFAWWPLAVHPRVESALLISYGIGTTAQALLDQPEVHRLDVVDPSPAILSLSTVIHREWDPLLDPRVTLHLEDGRHFLLTHEDRYDLITGEPPPPHMAGIVNLYTQEYFALMRARLKPGGVVTYWLPVDQLAPASTRSMLRGFCAVFPDCSLWSGSNYNWLMIGTNDLQGPVEEGAFLRQWRDQYSARKLAALGFERPEQLGATFIADATQLQRWLAAALPLTDAHPQRLSAEAPSDADLREYSAWMDDMKAEARFMQSRWISRWWPPHIREATRAYFPLQPLMNNQLHLSQVEAYALAEGLLAQAPLYTPALWLLGSDVDEQQRLDEVLKTQPYGPDHAFALGVRALLVRDFGRAAGFFLDAIEVEPRRGMMPAYYSLCRAGRQGHAQQLAEEYPDLQILAADLACERSVAGELADFDMDGAEADDEDDEDDEDEDEDEDDEDEDD